MALRLAHVYTCRDFNDAHAATYSAQCFTWTKEHSSTGMRGLLIFFLRPRTSGVPPGGISSSSSDSCCEHNECGAHTQRLNSCAQRGFVVCVGELLRSQARQNNATR
eukprot:43317-Prymnesium_polylepis.2